MRATGSVRVCRVDRIHLHTGELAVAVTAWTVQAELRLGTARLTAGRSRREMLAVRCWSWTLRFIDTFVSLRHDDLARYFQSYREGLVVARGLNEMYCSLQKVVQGEID